MWDQFDSGMSGNAGYMDESRMDTTTDDEKKGKRADNLVPVMIGHLLTSGPELQLHGLSVRVVSVVARINSIDQATTKVTYVIQDETGTIKAIKWNSAEDEVDSREQELKVGIYAHIYGLPREQEGEKHILILRMFKVKEINELTCHLLEVFYVAQMGLHKQHSVQKVQGHANSSSTSENYDFPGMDKDQSHVFYIIKNDISEGGIERDEIKSKVPSNIVSKIDDILEFLAGEGHIYTTRTDNHFKAT
ncbi:replication protein A 32 kDa subunit-A [Leptopilina boulardi]|uniref:replication protein A 32 kDa subunit-A n=1 Tax=Leptopilina boulardi TaxID=63433 RepID=UPI0021F50C47|nr:replication protein A 32 kDa subunit-A [Leptopilina boulardi]